MSAVGQIFPGKEGSATPRVSRSTTGGRVTGLMGEAAPGTGCSCPRVARCFCMNAGSGRVIRDIDNGRIGIKGRPHLETALICSRLEAGILTRPRQPR